MANLPIMRRLFVAALTATLLLIAVTPSGAFPHIRKWWQYDPIAWTNHWKSEATLRHAFNKWERKHPDATNEEEKDFTEKLIRRYRQMYFHKSGGVQHGETSFYVDTHGYCTPHLTGFYAASRTLPCGTQVSVRYGDKYVIVTIQDRGPYVDGRILDLSKSAFRRLAPMGVGHIEVIATVLRG